MFLIIQFSGRMNETWVRQGRCISCSNILVLMHFQISRDDAAKEIYQEIFSKINESEVKKSF
jgi:histidinol phosphatase-like PHP family hydrolase